MSPRTISVSTSVQEHQHRIQEMIMTILILGDDLPRTAMDGKCTVMEEYKYHQERCLSGGGSKIT
jgi:hypothetical protein